MPHYNTPHPHTEAAGVGPLKHTEVLEAFPHPQVMHALLHHPLTHCSRMPPLPPHPVAKSTIKQTSTRYRDTIAPATAARAHILPSSLQSPYSLACWHVCHHSGPSTQQNPTASYLNCLPVVDCHRDSTAAQEICHAHAPCGQHRIRDGSLRQTGMPWVEQRRAW